jgi:hypothetical protein
LPSYRPSPKRFPLSRPGKSRLAYEPTTDYDADQDCRDWVDRNEDAVFSLDADGLLDLIRQAAVTVGVLMDFIFSNERLSRHPLKKDDPEAHDLYRKADGYAQVAREHINVLVNRLAKAEAEAWTKRQRPGKQLAAGNTAADNDNPEGLPEEADRESSPAADPPHKQKPARPPIQSGEVTIRKLKSLYGDHAAAVLDEYLEDVTPDKKGAIRTFKVLKPLPTDQEFAGLQRQRFTSTVTDIVDGAFAELEELGCEMQTWHENLPESFQSNDKGCMIEEAANTLQGLNRPDVPEAFGAIRVYCPPSRNGSSRASRRDHAVDDLRIVVDALGEARAKCHGDDQKLFGEEIGSMVSELESAIEEAEGVEFPGMYS